MVMKRLLVSVPVEMEKALEKERKERMLETVHTKIYPKPLSKSQL